MSYFHTANCPVDDDLLRGTRKQKNREKTYFIWCSNLKKVLLWVLKFICEQKLIFIWLEFLCSFSIWKRNWWDEWWLRIKLTIFSRMLIMWIRFTQCLDKSSHFTRSTFGDLLKKKWKLFFKEFWRRKKLLAYWQLLSTKLPWKLFDKCFKLDWCAELLRMPWSCGLLSKFHYKRNKARKNYY